MRAMRAGVLAVMLLFSSLSAPKMTMITQVNTTNSATQSKRFKRSPNNQQAIKHTKSGVKEQTMPTVLTLKNLMHINEISTESPPCVQRNTREGTCRLSMESIKSCRKCPKLYTNIMIVHSTPRNNVNCMMPTRGLSSKLALFTYKFILISTVCSKQYATPFDGLSRQLLNARARGSSRSPPMAFFGLVISSNFILNSASPEKLTPGVLVAGSQKSNYPLQGQKWLCPSSRSEPGCSKDRARRDVLSVF